MLVHLGPAPSERPTSFLVGQLPTGFKGERDNVEAPLMAARALAWPPLFDVEPTLKKVNDAHPNMSAETPEAVPAPAPAPAPAKIPPQFMLDGAGLSPRGDLCRR